MPEFRKAKLKAKRHMMIAALLLSLLIGWVMVMLVFPWLSRTFSDPKLGELTPALVAIG